MKQLKLFLAALAIIVALAFSNSARAQTNAYDDAYHYAYASASWYALYNTPPGINYGFGFTTWAVATNGPANHGFFSTRNGTPLPVIASPTNFVDAPGNNGSAHVWGIFANGTGINSATMFRGFSNSLDTTVAFKLQWENNGIGSSIDKLGGFALRNGNETNSPADYFTGARFIFYYVGGGSNSFSIFDGNGANKIGVPFTSAALNCEFTLKTADTYRFVVKNAATGAILFLTDDQPLNGGGTIDSVALFAQQTDGNQNFNRMQIVSTSLTPPTIVNVSPANNSIFVDATTTNVWFEVTSLGSLIATNGVSLQLNGVTQSNLLFSSMVATNDMWVTNNTPILVNQTYNVTIIATDSNGNRTTNTSAFNTFLPTNPFIESEDYNYSAGGFIPSSFPNPYGAYANLLGTNGIDYLETDLSGTNNAYRPSDLPQIQLASDVDHAGYADFLVPDYNLGYVQFGEWLNYTRNLSNTTYTVYARAAGFGGNSVMEISRLANPTATTSNQPLASLGTCIIPHAGGSQVYSFAPLTDFFSQPVQIRFPGTNTLRTTCIGDSGSYNATYLILVPNTNAATLTPYLSAGYPYPAATAVALDSAISFTIANRQTAVNPASIQLFVDSNNVTSSITLSNNAAGTIVRYVPPLFLAPNSNHVVSVVFADDGGAPVTKTNTWQFTTANSPYITLPAEDAYPIGTSTEPGFAGRIYKVVNTAPTLSTLANAEAELSGTRTNLDTSTPYANELTGDFLARAFTETNALNYDITGAASGTPAFPYKFAFPYVTPGNPNNNIALETLMYLQLTNGNYVFAVRSDDGFRLTEGPATTNLTLGQFDGGRGNGTPSLIYVTVVTNGLYPMRLLYFQAGSGGNLEFYSLSNGVPILINDTNAAAIKAFQYVASSSESPVTLLNPAHLGNTTTFSYLTQAGRTHVVEYKNTLSDANWIPLTTNLGSGSITNITDVTATGGTRFYRVRSQ